MGDAWRLFGQPRGWVACSHLRLRTSACDVWVSARPNHSDSLGDLTEPGACAETRAFGNRTVQMREHSGRYSRYISGDIGVPPVDAPMDFAGLYGGLSGRRMAQFDHAITHAESGRIMIARGRDAGDLAISTSSDSGSYIFRV